jgi:hypothetical protein
MRATMRYAIIISLLLSIATSCLAEKPRNVATYKKHMGSEEHKSGNFDHNLHHMLYLMGTGDTYRFLNLKKANSGNEVLYCQPENSNLNAQDYKSIFEKFIYSHNGAKHETLVIPEAMLFALQEKFPCL